MTPAICHVYGQFNQVRERACDELRYIDRLGIPADITVAAKLDPELIPIFRERRARGLLVAPSLYPADVDSACVDANWWAYDTDQCVRLLEGACAYFSDIGFGGLDAISTYTPGNGLIEACRRTGIRYLLGFCSPTVINDGHWKITHLGAPLGPYLASSDDYRRPVPGDDHSVLISSMELRNPLTCAEHWSEGPFCPLNLIMGDRTIEIGERPLETLAACEDWIQMSEQSGLSKWFHINLQWFTSPKCYDINRRCLEWLADQAAKGRIRFSSLRERRGELLGNGVVSQVTWWRGGCMGQTVGNQPPGGQECIVDESPVGQWLFRRNEAGARRHYDWTSAWNFPSFDPQGLKPDFVRNHARIESIASDIEPTRRIIEIQWEAAIPDRLCVWTGLEGLLGPLRVLDDGGFSVKIIPHPRGIGGALLLDPATSTGRIKVAIGHGGRGVALDRDRWMGLMAAETVVIDRRPLTRLAPAVPAFFMLPLSTNCRHHVRWESIVGGVVERGILAPGESIHVKMDGRACASVLRLWDATEEDLFIPTNSMLDERARLLAANRMVAAEFAPGDVVSDNLLALSMEEEIPSWVVIAARNAASREIAVVDLLAKAFEAGPRLAALHCAADLPMGTMGRVRAQRYDRHVNSYVEFFPIYYDYGQSYGFGIAGWSQFWQIDLGIRGLVAGRNYRLVLNVYDPQSRGEAVRILGRPCDQCGHALSDAMVIELRDQRSVPQGVASRHGMAAMIAVNLPNVLCVTGCVDIIIRGHGEAVRYDRLDEGFGAVFLAHAWLSEIIS